MLLLSNIMSEFKRSSFQLRVDPQPVLKIGKSERTRAAILDAALELVWSRPFRDMTVNSLMASTGVSRSAFYQYFKDLHELMKTLLDSLHLPPTIYPPNSDASQD